MPFLPIFYEGRFYFNSDFLENLDFSLLPCCPFSFCVGNSCPGHSVCPAGFSIDGFYHPSHYLHANDLTDVDFSDIDVDDLADPFSYPLHETEEPIEGPDDVIFDDNGEVPF